MILGVGIDSVAISRFVTWHQHQDRLMRIFSPAEISYCISVPAKSAERFALRFAAREAAFKALHSAGIPCPPFLTFCKSITVSAGGPLIINPLPRFVQAEPLHFLASGTHAENTATVVVIIAKNAI